jgi:ABC-type glycerol-3-phosphate transport system permease component
MSCPEGLCEETIIVNEGGDGRTEITKCKPCAEIGVEEVKEVTEDEFVAKYRSDIDKAHYVPTFTEIKDHPYLKKTIAFFTGSLVGKLLGFILLVLVIGILCLTCYGLYKMKFDEWKTLFAIILIPVICSIAVWYAI